MRGKDKGLANRWFVALFTYLIAKRYSVIDGLLCDPFDSFSCTGGKPPVRSGSIWCGELVPFAERELLFCLFVLYVQAIATC